MVFITAKEENEEGIHYLVTELAKLKIKDIKLFEETLAYK